MCRFITACIDSKQAIHIFESTLEQGNETWRQDRQELLLVDVTLCIRMSITKR